MRYGKRSPLCGAVLALFILSLSVFPGRSLAQSCPSPSTGYDPYDYEAIAVSSVAIGFTPAKLPPSAEGDGMALVTVEGNTISFSVIGTPTATIGHQVVAGQALTVCGLPALQAFKAIRVTADAVLKVTYFKAR